MIPGADACAIVELVFHPTRISILICLSSDDATILTPLPARRFFSAHREQTWPTKFFRRDLNAGWGERG